MTRPTPDEVRAAFMTLRGMRTALPTGAQASRGQILRLSAGGGGRAPYCRIVFYHDRAPVSRNCGTEAAKILRAAMSSDDLVFAFTGRRPDVDAGDGTLPLFPAVPAATGGAE